MFPRHSGVYENKSIEKIQLHFQHEIDAREPEWHACINLLALSLAAHVHNNIAEPKKKLFFDTAAGKRGYASFHIFNNFFNCTEIND